MIYTTIEYNKEKNVGYLNFARPKIHNAFNSTVITEMSQLFDELLNDKELRLIILSGKGKSFCAGADLNWMRSVKDQSFEKNLDESNKLADLFYKIYSFPKPVIGRVKGAAIGGGTGFVAVCDISIAAESAKFSFSEVKIGVVPACICPYVIKKMGEGKARELFISGERMNAKRAHEVGLVNAVVTDDMLDSEVDKLKNWSVKFLP